MHGIQLRTRAVPWLYILILLAFSCLPPKLEALQVQDTSSDLPLDGALNDLPLGASARQEVELAIRSHNYAGAETTLLRAASQHPKVSLLYEYLGRIFFIDHKYLNAAIAMKKAEALQLLDEKDRFTLAMAYIILGRPDWARPELDKLVRASPRNPLFLYWLGRLDYDDQNLSGAAAKFEQAIALDPDFMKAYDNLGLCFEGLGKYDEAIQQYRHAVRLNREHNIRSLWPSLNLGTLLARLNRFEEAEPLLRESLRFDANFAQTHYQLGVLLVKQNKMTLAIEELKRAADLDPTYPQPHYALARIYRRAGDLRDARREVQIFQDLRAKTSAPHSE